jgi:hypothetical protein
VRSLSNYYDTKWLPEDIDRDRDRRRLREMQKLSHAGLVKKENTKVI